MSLLGNLFELFFQCLGSLCTFYFIYKIVSVQNIVQMYAEQHTGAGCESINKTSDAPIMIFVADSDTDFFRANWPIPIPIPIFFPLSNQQEIMKDSNTNKVFI